MNILTKPLSIQVTGIPKGQPRPKARSRGKHASVYDPGTANTWKASIAEAFKEYHGMSYCQPLSVGIVLALPRPKSHFNSKLEVRPNAPQHHTSKPDLDNAAKAILDAMTDFQFWKDDSMVTQLSVCKVWTDGKAGATIDIFPES